MLFCSFHFLVFFAVVLGCYWALPWARARVLFLLAASFFFYASWNKWLALLIFVSTALDYLLARGLEATASPRLRKLLLALSVTANLGLLCYFKYANFFLDSLGQALHACGASTSLPVLSVLLPIGISFYTFEAISYVVDVYQGRLRAERDFTAFLLFILFFPHLVAGPIVRARDFLPQVPRPKRWSWPRAQVGAMLFLLGLFKKLAIADRMALFADPVFGDPLAFRQSAAWYGLVAYALQIYCDFSGYSDMALGCAHLLGYKLAVNFHMPYLSANVSELWRRWHISLSSWLRDYLFVPLGGSRGGRWRTARNLMVTMLLGGLWHGAAWTFVLWGALHGAFLVGHRAFRAWCERHPLLDRLLGSGPGTALRVALTFLAVALAWVFFRAPSLGHALDYFQRLAVNDPTARTAPLAPVGLLLTVLLVAAGHALGQRRWAPRLARRLPAPVLGVSYGLLLVFALLLAPSGEAPFIYFQF
jgi:alginate O-acetyltransferase complex protein AlgI